jgi:hypothetical protein
MIAKKLLRLPLSLRSLKSEKKLSNRSVPVGSLPAFVACIQFFNDRNAFVIKQGAEGDFYYILDSGAAEVWLSKEGQSSKIHFDLYIKIHDLP